MISVARVNSDVVNKLVNLASLTAGFVKRFDGKLADTLSEPALYATFTSASERIAEALRKS